MEVPSICCRLTHISDLYCYTLIQEVQNHDDDKVDAGSGYGCGELGRDKGSNHLQLIGGAVLHDTGKRRKHRQTVRNHTDYTGDNQRDLGFGAREAHVIHTKQLTAISITTPYGNMLDIRTSSAN